MKKYMIDYKDGSGSGCDKLFDTIEAAERHMDFYTEKERKGLVIVEIDTKYDKPITTEQEVRDFFHHILFDLKINFHPDDDFNNYINTETHEPTMTDDEAAHYNNLMDCCFLICGDKTYDIANEVWETYLNSQN